MTVKVHPDVIDNGLSILTANGLMYTICQTEPLTLTDCQNVLGSGGKRIMPEKTLTSGQVTIVDGVNSDSRKAVFPDVTFLDASLVAIGSNSADFWIVVYDGSRILAKTDQLAPTTIVEGASFLSNTFSFGIDQ